MVGDTAKVLAALNDAEVRYLVVGGVAMVLHGHLRATKDLDLVVHLESANLSRALRVFEDLGFQPSVPVPIQDFANPEKREEWIEGKNMMVFSVWLPSNPFWKVDIFVKEPFDFDVVYDRAATIELGNVQAKVVPLDELILMKKEAGRSQDLADLEFLNILKRDQS